LKRFLGPLLTLVLAVGVGFAVYISLQDQRVIVVSGLIGSEKEAFFLDERVVERLRREHGLEVDFEKVGSRRIATEGGVNGTVDNYDFAFPAGIPAAEKIRRDFDVLESYRVFFTPMTIASWSDVVDVLEANNIVQQRNGYYGIVDMRGLIGLMQDDIRWEDLPDSDSFDVGRKVLVKSTNILSSNSAAMYLALASYIVNEDRVVQDDQQIRNVLPTVEKLFLDQGFLPGSSATPFEDYLIKGMGNSPLVMMYESQFLYQASLADGSIRPDMVLLYPEPTIYTQHVLTAMSEGGERLGEALTTDSELQKLAIENGYRSNDPTFTSDFQTFIRSNDLENVPDNLNEVIDPPTYEIIERMIERIEQALVG
jgi:hypothetical protein